jgi:trimethylamine-N-oxide reductase (cytochrome c)
MITSSKACSDLSQATSANTCIASIRKCTDAESENRAYEPPVIEEHQGSQAVSARGFRDRAAKIRNAALADMTPGEKLFYERCTVCHVAHEPGDLTRTEWRAVTEDVMFPRAGLSEEQQQLVREFLSNNAKDAR